ncbi:MAG: hypothetical protein M3T49_01925 [Candidatus Eremiobacteraeota bacterium]|nr:hypothetical protein [Candidatus Eremiobacteraeota bacterium]
MIDKLVSSVAGLVTGDSYRRSIFDRCVFEEPLERYRSSNLAGRLNLDVFAVALAATTRRTVEELVLDLGVDEYVAVARKPDKERLANLAAFVAWRQTIALLEEERAAAEETDSDRRESDDWIRDAGLVETTMYPQTEQVQAAIGEQMHASKPDETHPGPSAHERAVSEAIDRLLGVDSDPLSDEFGRRAVAVSAVFAKDRRRLAKTIGGLAGVTRAAD